MHGPHHFSDQLHPELRIARWFPRGVVRPWLLPLLKRLPHRAVKLPASVVLRERMADSAGQVRVDIISPRAAGGPRPALLWIHGGGYILGSSRQDHALCARIAEELGLVVAVVEYRLAPQHPFPTPLEDCYAAFELMHRESSALGIDPRRIMIGGASAGGGLAAALTLLVHDRERPAPILQLLVYPMLDDRTVTPSAARHFHRLWDQPSNALGWRSYLGRPPGGLDVSDHAAPARRSDLRGLPPTWIGVGTLDLFHEEDVAYAERLRAAGVATTLEVVPGAFHGFDVVLPKARVSEAFLVSQLSAMRAALAPG